MNTPIPNDEVLSVTETEGLILEPDYNLLHTTAFSTEDDDDILEMEMPTNGSPARPTCNRREQHLHNGIDRARKILNNRQVAVNDAANAIGNYSKAVFGAGIFLATLGCPLIGLGAAAFSLGSQLLNKHIEKVASSRLTVAQEALLICEKKEEDIEAKKKAYLDLKKTAKQIHYWENSQKIGGTVFKFAFGEVATPITMLFAAMDTQREITRSNRKEITSSERLTGVIGQIHKGLGFKEQALSNPHPN